MKGGENCNFLCVILHLISKAYKMDIYQLYITPFTDIVAPVFKYVSQNQCSVYGIYFLMWFIPSQLFSLLNMFNVANYV